MNEVARIEEVKPYGVIYKWTNKLSGKAYIGQTTQDPEERKAEHLKPSTDTAIARAIRKHGIENFDFEVIDDSATNQEELNALEKYWSEYYHTWVGDPEGWGYNIKECGGEHGRLPIELRKAVSDGLKRYYATHEHPSTGRHCSEETKAKIAAAPRPKGENHPWWGRKHTQEERAKISQARKGKGVGKDNPFYGRRHSEETKHLLSEKAKLNNQGSGNPMYGKKHTEEAKQKMSAVHYDCSGANNPRAKRTQCVETGQIFDCQKDAAEWAKVPKSRICLACKNPSSSSGGYHWRTI